MSRALIVNEFSAMHVSLPCEDLVRFVYDDSIVGVDAFHVRSPTICSLLARLIAPRPGSNLGRNLVADQDAEPCLRLVRRGDGPPDRRPQRRGAGPARS